MNVATIAWAVTVAISITAISASTAWYAVKQDEAILEMVKLGANPREARCALNPSYGCQDIVINGRQSP